MHYNKLNVFYFVVKNGSFSKNGLGLSASVASRHVSSLEEDIGFKLLERGTRKKILTPKGEKIFQRYERLYQDSKNIKEEIEEYQDSPSDHLNIEVGIHTPWLSPNLNF